MIVKHAQTLIIATLLTAVVWLFAEAESVRSKDLTLTVEFSPEPVGGLVLEPLDRQAWRDRVEVSVSGSSAALAGLEAGSIKPIRLAPGMPGLVAEPGESILDLREVLRLLPQFAERGVSINRTNPPTVRVWADRLTTRTVKVVVDAGRADLDGPASVTPASIRLSAPESVMRRLSDTATALVRLTPESLTGLVPGRAETVRSAVVLPPTELAGIDHVIVEPARADVTLTIRSRTSTATVPNVPVQIMMPALVGPQWDVKAEPTFLNDVQASGPSDLVEQLKRGEIKVFAVVVLSADDLEKGVNSKDVIFQSTPPTVLSFKVDNPIVRLTVDRRAPVKPSP